jgi:hypothetical protein
MALISPIQFDKAWTATAEHAIGQRVSDGQGRIFRYAKAGSGAVDRGKLCVAPTVVANHINLSWQTAPAVGARTVYVTLGATLATQDQYKDGWLVVQDGTGEGRAYSISGNLAAASAGTITVFLREAIDTAGALAELNVDLIANPWNGIVISVTDQADQPTGVPLRAVTASYYGFLQTGGPCAVWFDENTVNGMLVTTGTGTAGQVELQDAGGEPIVGQVMGNAGVDTEYQVVELLIDRPQI